MVYPSDALGLGSLAITTPRNNKIDAKLSIIFGL